MPLLYEATARLSGCSAARWVDDKVSSDRQEWAGAVVVEHRYITDIVRGAVADGLRVR
jgi:hypothetical protein